MGWSESAGLASSIVGSDGTASPSIPMRGSGVGRRRLRTSRSAGGVEPGADLPGGLMQRADGGMLGLTPVRIIPKGIDKWKILGKPAIKTPKVRPAPDVAEFFGLKTSKVKPHYKRNTGFTWVEAHRKWRKWTAKLDDDTKALLPETPPTKESVIGEYIKKHTTKLAAANARRAKQLSFTPAGSEFTSGGGGVATPVRVSSLFKRKGHEALMEDKRAIDFEAIVKFNSKIQTFNEKQKNEEREAKLGALEAKGLRHRDQRAKEAYEKSQQQRDSKDWRNKQSKK
eukprot:GDKK01004630.1.p1 GENE.GDKK01004630.1~~GDKK01004630.1.p1  ORF type:complete len:284 (+),score=65.76 GDKK01004630.1:1-852(+)